jgi:hypothetical protein
MSDEKETNEVAGRRRDRRRRRRAAEPGAGSRGEALAALQAEVVLLREENARLKEGGLQEPDLGALLRRARSLPRGGRGPEDAADDAAQLLVDAIVLRESLLAMCREISRSMTHVEARLAELGTAMDDTIERS